MAHALELPHPHVRAPEPEDELDEFIDHDDIEEEVSVTDNPAFDRESSVRVLRKRLRKAENDAAHAHPPAILASNMRRLQALIGLNDVEVSLLTFVTLVHTDKMLDLMSDWIGDLTSARVFHVLSSVLRLQEKDVRAALSPRGTLAQSGLLTVDRNQRWTLAAKLDLLSDGFADRIVSDDIDPVDLLRGMVSLAPAATLTLDDFEHVAEPVSLMHMYLGRAAATRRCGVNILIHGEPGTGKTELARMLGGMLDLPLYEIAGDDTSGDAVLGEQRLRAFRAAQAFFAERPVLIAFDEAEDVLSGYGSKEQSVAQRRKAWLNHALEENPVPTVWLSNSVQGLDPAFVRRFDVVLHMPVPPASMRERIFRTACDSRLSDATAQRISRHASLTPGVVARAAAVLDEVSGQWPPERYNATFERLLSGTLEAQGHVPLSRVDSPPFGADYALSYVNADCDLFALAQGVKREQSARLCFYGPPGTGKTAFAAWLAHEIDRPLLARRASDLLSPFVGETEHNIARAFEETLREGAVLCIDEGDSFLRDRSLSHHSWEVTAVNEMLAQMERFSGVLIISTNLVDMLDEASLRRFDAKILFRHLSVDQRRACFTDRCHALGLHDADIDTVFTRQLGKADTLSLGDFAAVVRRHSLHPFQSAPDFALALAAECALKQRGAAPIGFV
ncbi:ATPase AAA [Paraburkholderia hospita]|uniref:ATPase AAA n=1 Tax=Paraburkholderia hospita TaxID=169430 RepID=A0ABN0FIX7_9BURK|nr:ATP-binding protein [Paraburkholderia hospita]EIM98549.1 ATPase AAA [Paraburkholderia hospita]